jgi:DNA-binding transcriptional LysR family regulator
MGTLEDLDAVLAFTRVVQLHSFGAAAKALGVPKSTLSRRVARLERRLGVQLLRRTTRQLALTDVGQLYFARCERVIADLEDAERQVFALQEAPRGVLRVTTPADFGFNLLAHLVASFQHAYPEVQVLLTATNARLDLVAGGFDVALRAGSLTDSSLVARKLVSSQRGLFASVDYLARRGTPKRVADLSHHDCIVFGGDRLHATWHLYGPDGEAQVQVAGRFGCNDFNFVHGAVASGLGIGQLPTFVRSAHAESHGIVRVLPEYATEGGSLYVVYPSQRHLSAKVRAFVDFADKHIRDWLDPERCTRAMAMAAALAFERPAAEAQRKPARSLTKSASSAGR